MTSILNFIRDWLPSLAIIAAGGWAFFTWLRRERRVTRREKRSLEVELTWSVTKLDKQRCLLRIQAAIHNPGPFHVLADPDLTEVLVFKVPKDLANGYMDVKDDLGEALFVGHPFDWLKRITFERNTTSTRSSYFVIDEGSLYLIRYRLRRDDLDYYWSRDAVVDLRKEDRTY